MAAKKNGVTEISAGDTCALRFTILTPSGGNPSYANPVATFALGKRKYPEPSEAPEWLKTAGSGVTIEQDGATWKATVALQSSDTIGLVGLRYYELRVEDGSAEQTVATGQLEILPIISE
jgi:hypothetical protein